MSALYLAAGLALMARLLAGQSQSLSSGASRG